MCGIVGILLPRGQRVARAALDQSLETLGHRGPDGRGVWTDGEIGLGHGRLSIIDVAGSPQPMHADGLHLSFNGEIYNYQALRAELAGYPFRTAGDGEVILALYARRGIAGLAALRGMFAFALWDARRRELVLARDRMGIKPLYIAELAGGGTAFASETKALERLHGVDTTLDDAAVNEYFARQYVGGDATIFRGIRRLPTGEVRVLGDRVRIARPWDAPRSGPSTMRYADATRLVETRLAEAVSSHLVSDVPVGVFLSGGLDSSLVLALARRGGADLDTFSVGFGAAELDETGIAADVARHFGTRHHELRVAGDELLAAVPRVLASLDQPLADYAIVPTYVMSRKAREHVKVVLGGEGADELFAGYRWRYAPFLAREHLPGVIERRLPLPPPRPGVLDDAARRRLLGPRTLPRAALPGQRAMARILAAHRDHGPLDAALHADQADWLANDLLIKVDEMGMLASLEARVPYLDLALVDLVNPLPAHFKMTARTTKRILRDIGARHLPRAVSARKKHGFTAPVARWLLGPLRDRFQSHVPAARDWIDPGEAQRLWAALARSPDRGTGLRAWSLLVFAWWLAERPRSSRLPVREHGAFVLPEPRGSIA